MLWAPPPRARTISNLGTVGAAFGATVPAGTSNNYGTVTELIAAGNNTQDNWGIMVMITGTGANTVASESMLDILVGGATDDVLISSLACGYLRTDQTSAANYFFPVHIPAGIRIAARLASVRTGFDANVGIILYGGGIPPFGVGRKVTTYGTKQNNARGVNLSVASSGGAATATEITASTAEGHFALMPGVQVENDTGTANSWVNIGIGLGAATEERIGTWHYNKNAGESQSGPWPAMPVFRHVPAGTRLTILGSDSATDTMGGLIYAVS